MTSPSDHSARRRRAFTLAEILLVLLIIGLLAALAAPMLNRRSAGREELGAYELATLLRDARLAARRSRRTHLVRLTETAGQWRAEVFRLDDVGAEQPVADDRWAGPVDLPVVNDFEQTDPDGAAVAGADKVVTFLPGGCLNHTRIRLDGGSAGALDVEVAAPSALVRLAAADPAGASATDPTRAIEAYWDAQCRKAAP